jgi:hypothetical protein
LRDDDLPERAATFGFAFFTALTLLTVRDFFLDAAFFAGIA